VLNDVNRIRVYSLSQVFLSYTEEEEQVQLPEEVKLFELEKMEEEQVACRQVSCGD
jgi:hypothetical protein